VRQLRISHGWQIEGEPCDVVSLDDLAKAEARYWDLMRNGADRPTARFILANAIQTLRAETRLPVGLADYLADGLQRALDGEKDPFHVGRRPGMHKSDSMRAQQGQRVLEIAFYIGARMAEGLTEDDAAHEAAEKAAVSFAKARKAFQKHRIHARAHAELAIHEGRKPFRPDLTPPARVESAPRKPRTTV
jgi:hypothetical protein